MRVMSSTADVGTLRRHESHAIAAFPSLLHIALYGEPESHMVFVMIFVLCDIYSDSLKDEA